MAVIGTRGYPSFYGGFETAVRKLAPYLADQSWNVTVYGRSADLEQHSDKDPRVQVITTAGVENKSLSTLSYGLTACLHAFWTKPDVALVMNVANGFWLPLLRLRRIPTIVNVDGIEWERAKWGRLAKTIFKIGAFMTARFGTVLIADSKEIGRRWRDEFGRDCVFVPYGGEAGSDHSLEDGLSPERYVLVVARFVPENTLPEFISAARNLARDYQVVIVGSSGYGGHLEDDVRLLAEENENVRWLGHVSDDQRLLALWRHCGAYFHGHSVGGTNPALVQAMANGAPVVARDTVYNREVLGNDAAFCLPEGDEIERAVRRVMDTPSERKRLSNISLERVQQGYTWEAVCAAYERELRSQAEEKSLSEVTK
ncbi:glycosyltransferase [Pseudarthrobacter sp. SL88]|uniref:glycosyltransferase n=1 Tax=Pseudarthrobacter sp. SL88 TaxID=2994666 RepID=UPI002273878E|nr:glycosyltransferase [Pseudarthrobacter sp. SL88]MCY1673807.1 glycosyltransferase [Pseudarthrobacter sp. SL88]